MERLLTWKEWLAGVRGVAGISEVERDGVRWVVTHCYSARGAEKLLLTLQQQGQRAVSRRDRDSLWQSPSEGSGWGPATSSPAKIGPLFEWRVWLRGDSRVLGCGEVDRNGGAWVVAHCPSEADEEALFGEL
jgi:hypothetical protein